MRVIFMGTPDFAVPVLEKIVDDGYDVVAVFTQQDKPRGRRMIMTPPAVKVTAENLGLSIFQPKTLRTEVDTIKGLNPDVIVVAAFGMLLPKDVLEIPKFGCINTHASILPKYRGAAPIQWAIIDGEKQTGVTAMLMDEGLDTGNIIKISTVDILPNETAGELFDKLSAVGANLISDVLAELKEHGKFVNPPSKQDDSKATYVKVLSKDDSPIDWTKTQTEIHNFIRGLSPWPIATTNYYGDVLRIHESKKTEMTTKEKPGTIVIKEGNLYVATGDNKLIQITAIQATGGKKMLSADYLRGHILEGVFK
ncbi:MAG: methionyl-tRNA formyltransferase [Ruminococcaceae bacterium]|nr:methionyl-tRNA formyltransferase [Oscillospiraceae bacterium]